MALIKFPWVDESQITQKFDRPFHSLQREMNRMLDQFLSEDYPVNWTGKNGFSPSVDVSENKDCFMIRVELPGVKDDDVKVSFHDNILSIQGEKRFEKEEKDEDMLRYERQYGSFYRSIPFPVQIDDSKLKAKLKDGVLKITLPKTPAAIAKSKNIQIEKA
ncbi:MAG: molecular chaperone [Deltaproteobacteria bacterium CG11_big_fil_rev_8_21_14_0_20_45_16]|nr:MAG: molecular chaperone [Deltaproteobacteria bacterium CG11_big_fil_rev_8_21_14_0_20_45_16]